jgi:hypothetical protein
MAGCHKNHDRMSQELWPSVAGLLAGCHRIGGRMSQEYSNSVSINIASLGLTVLGNILKMEN